MILIRIVDLSREYSWEIIQSVYCREIRMHIPSNSFSYGDFQSEWFPNLHCTDLVNIIEIYHQMKKIPRKTVPSNWPSQVFCRVHRIK